ncbi:hypothetical protein HMPREF3180_01588 [Leptotrichia wadei]|uniref:Uncharacterized protein n=1 Tax=Leptotrichia wadei TaxID=157687 RepID=A0A134A6I8_9FUSO|nr:hypothetical protein [Leptotrichia wadei]KXB63328.1 hypothetical protein HMPREF3180_01588 [Leptotrichia wadei]
MKDENIKLLIKDEYENGTSIRVLAEKYNQKVGTIKSWISREKWIKKKENTATSKKKNATTKRNHLRVVANDKETQIKSDIIDDVSKYEIMAKNGISERTYYRKKQSVRVIQIERSEKILRTISEKKYNDAEKRLSKIAEKKSKLETQFLESEKLEKEEMQLIAIKLNLLKEFERDIKIGARVIGDYRQAELEEQLADELLQQEKLEIEKAKIKKDDEKEIEKENEMIELLKKITKKVEKNE